LSVVHPPEWVLASGGTYINKVEVKWKPVYGATGYKVCRDTAANVLATLPNSASSFQDFTAADGCSHAYFVDVIFPGTGQHALSRADMGWTQ
jgi:hypothetical protein